MSSPEQIGMADAPISRRAIAAARSAENDVREIQALAKLANVCMRHLVEANVAAADLASVTLAAAAKQLAEGQPSAELPALDDSVRLALSAAAEGYVSACMDLVQSALGQLTAVTDEAQEIISAPVWRRVQQ